MTPAELDLELWNLFGTNERDGNGEKKLDRVYRRLMRFEKTGTSPTDAFNTKRKKGKMKDVDLLPALVAEAFALHGKAVLSRKNAAKLIASHGESITSDFFLDPPKTLVTIRPLPRPCPLYRNDRSTPS